jgi:hypothetical protein
MDEMMPSLMPTMPYQHLGHPPDAADVAAARVAPGARIFLKICAEFRV